MRTLCARPPERSCIRCRGRDHGPWSGLSAGSSRPALWPRPACWRRCRNCAGCGGNGRAAGRFHPYRPPIIVDADHLWRAVLPDPMPADIDAAPIAPRHRRHPPGALQPAGHGGVEHKTREFRLGLRSMAVDTARGDAIRPPHSHSISSELACALRPASAANWSRWAQADWSMAGASMMSPPSSISAPICARRFTR